jgi:hypothetical protein
MYKKPPNSEYIVGLLLTKEGIDEIITKISNETNISDPDINYKIKILQDYSIQSINKLNNIISSNTSISDDVIKYIVMPYLTFDSNKFYFDKLNTRYECILVRKKFTSKLYFDIFKTYYVIGYKVDNNLITQNWDLIEDYKIQFRNIWNEYFSNKIDLFQIPIV